MPKIIVSYARPADRRLDRSRGFGVASLVMALLSMSIAATGLVYAHQSWGLSVCFAFSFAFAPPIAGAYFGHEGLARSDGRNMVERIGYFWNSSLLWLYVLGLVILALACVVDWLQQR